MTDFVRRNLDSDGDIKIGDFVTDKDVVLLAVKSRLQFFQGEWFLDTEDGTPYFQDIFVKPARLNVIESIIKRRIKETPGIVSLNKFDMSFVPGTRKLIIDFEAFDQFDNVVTTQVSV
jgi:hypothetical protein